MGKIKVKTIFPITNPGFQIREKEKEMDVFKTITKFVVVFLVKVFICYTVTRKKILFLSTFGVQKSIAKLKYSFNCCWRSKRRELITNYFSHD